YLHEGRADADACAKRFATRPIAACHALADYDDRRCASVVLSIERASFSDRDSQRAKVVVRNAGKENQRRLRSWPWRPVNGEWHSAADRRGNRCSVRHGFHAGESPQTLQKLLVEAGAGLGRRIVARRQLNENCQHSIRFEPKRRTGYRP